MLKAEAIGIQQGFGSKDECHDEQFMILCDVDLSLLDYIFPLGTNLIEFIASIGQFGG